MTERVLGSVRDRDTSPCCYVGGTGWGQTKWLGKVYPRGTQPKDFLSHYVRQFNSIEFNALWYNLQPKPVIERWAALAGPDFRFCPKFSNTISHERLLEGAERDTELFVDHMRSFGVTLGLVVSTAAGELRAFTGEGAACLSSRAAAGFPDLCGVAA